MLLLIYIAAPQNSVINLKADATSVSSILATWDYIQASRDLIIGYNVSYTWGGRKQIETVLHPSKNIELTGLEASTDYVIEVCPYNAFGEGPCDKVASITPDEGIILKIFNRHLTFDVSVI